MQVCDHPALLSERAAHGIVSGVNRARRQAAARQAGGSSDVEVIEDSSEGEELEDSEEGEWESGERLVGGGAGGSWWWWWGLKGGWQEDGRERSPRCRVASGARCKVLFSRTCVVSTLQCCILPCADSEDYSSDEERQQQRARHAKRKPNIKAKAQAQAKAQAAGLPDSEWDGWASPELEQQLLDEVHTTGGVGGRVEWE